MKHGALNYEQARLYMDQGYYRLIDAFTTEESSEIRQFIENEADKQARDYTQKRHYQEFSRLSYCVGHASGQIELTLSLTIPL